MKWVTREKARVDRIACPWLITRFIDKNPTFLFVPANQVMAVAEREKAIPYDVPGVELGHVGDHCSFDAFLAKHKLEDPALRALALIVRGADTDARQLTPSRRACTRWPPASRPSPKTTMTTWLGSSTRTTPCTRTVARTLPALAHDTEAHRLHRPSAARGAGRIRPRGCPWRAGTALRGAHRQRHDRCDRLHDE